MYTTPPSYSAYTILYRLPQYEGMLRCVFCQRSIASYLDLTHVLGLQCQISLVWELIHVLRIQY